MSKSLTKQLLLILSLLSGYLKQLQRLVERYWTRQDGEKSPFTWEFPEEISGASGMSWVGGSGGQDRHCTAKGMGSLKLWMKGLCHPCQETDFLNTTNKIGPVWFVFRSSLKLCLPKCILFSLACNWRAVTCCSALQLLDHAELGALPLLWLRHLSL